MTVLEYGCTSFYFTFILLMQGYSELYDSPEDIDLWSAGITEIPLPGAMVGPTFACIMGRSFHNLKRGDRSILTHMVGI